MAFIRHVHAIPGAADSNCDEPPSSELATQSTLRQRSAIEEVGLAFKTQA